MERQNWKYRTVAREYGLIMCDILPVRQDRFSLVWGRSEEEHGFEVHHVWFEREATGVIRFERHIRQRVREFRLEANDDHGTDACSGQCDREMEISLVILSRLFRMDALPNATVPYFGTEEYRGRRSDQNEQL